MKTEFAFGLRREAQRHAAWQEHYHIRKAVSPLRSATALQNLAAMLLCVLALVASSAHAATNDLTALLQQGLFEEQANRNLDAAIADYQSLATQFDKDRQLAATAIFRLGECYRAQGRTNEAVVQYQRILRDFSDQTTLATLSQQDLAGMGFTQTDDRRTIQDSTETSVKTRLEHQRAVELAAQDSAAASAEARSLAARISGIEKIKSVQEQGLAVQAIFPDETLKRMLLQLPKLRAQETMLKNNPQLTYDQLTRTQGYAVAVGDDGLDLAGFGANGERHSTNLLADAERELKTQNTWIEQRVDFILGIQKARLKVLQSTALVAAIQNYSQRPSSAEGKRIRSGAQPEADSRPQTFNIDFGPAGEPSKQVGPAAAGREGDFWNTVGPATPFSNVHTESGLKFANGQPCPIEAELINLGGSWGNEGRMGVKAPMYDTFNYPFNNQGGNSRVFLYHVPAGTYDLYLYGHSALQTYYGDYEVTVGGRDYGRKKTSADGDAIENTEWVEGSQYVRFPSVKVADGDRVEILIRPGAQQTLQTTFPPAPLRSSFYGPGSRDIQGVGVGNTLTLSQAAAANKTLRDMNNLGAGNTSRGTPRASFDGSRDGSVEAIERLEGPDYSNAAPVRTFTRTFADAMICGLQLVPSGE